MSFAGKLKELRIKNKLTQEALASKLYVSRQAVTKWEGAKGLPDEETIEKIASLFGVTKDYFFKDEEVNLPVERKKHNRLRIALITIIILLVLSIGYVIVHFVYVVPALIRVDNEIERQKRIEVAAYLSYSEDDLTLDEIRDSNYPYIIDDNNVVEENKLYRRGEYEYLFNVPYDMEFKLYLNKLIYNSIDKVYKTESIIIDEFIFGFSLNENEVRIERRNPVKELTIYSYDSHLRLIKAETFKRDINGNIYSDLNGCLNKPYLDSYQIEGAFQYTLTLMGSNNRAEVLNVMESKTVVTFLIPDDWLISSYSFETKFII